MAVTTRAATPRSRAVSKRKREDGAVGDYPKTASKRRRTQSVLTRDDITRISFADLPGELRTAIYEYALVPKDGSPLRFSGGAARHIAINLLAASKAIRQEAEALLYKLNTFRIDMPCMSQSLVPKHELEKIVLDSKTCTLHPKDLQQRLAARDASNDAQLQWSQAASLPGVRAALDTIGPKRLRLMLSFIFAYHARPHALKSLDDVLQCAEQADIAIRLNLVKKAPYYTVSIEHDISNDTDAKRRKILLGSATSAFNAQIATRELRHLAKNDILFLGEWLCRQCRRCRIRDERQGGEGPTTGDEWLFYRYKW